MKRAAVYAVGILLTVAAIAALFVMPMGVMKGYGTIWLAADTFLIWYFVLGYGLLSRWNDSEVGVHLLVFSLAIAVEFTVLLYLRLSQGATAATAGLIAVTAFYIALTFIFSWRAVIFTKAQIQARRGQRERLDDRHAQGDVG